MTLQEIDFSQDAILEIPISNLPNTNIKRYFVVDMQAASISTVNNEMKISGNVIYKVLSNGEEITAQGIEPMPKSLFANNDKKVDINGNPDPNGEIGQYNWIYWATYYKIVSPQEAITSAVLRADSEGIFN